MFWLAPLAFRTRCEGGSRLHLVNLVRRGKKNRPILQRKESNKLFREYQENVGSYTRAKEEHEYTNIIEHITFQMATFLT